MPAKAGGRSLGKENERLRARLDELEETLHAIRSGEVDALVVETAGEDQVFTLRGADQTYRLMVEEMQEGAATLSEGGLVLYCNQALAALLDVPADEMLGAPLVAFLDGQGEGILSGLLQPGASAVKRGEVSFRRSGGMVLTQVSVTLLPLAGAPVFCLIVADLTEAKQREAERAQLDHERMARAAAEEAHRLAQEEIERRRLLEADLRQAEKDRSELLGRERAARAQAEEASRLKDEFLATLSHELRSPLSAILAWSHVLRQPGLDPAVASRGIEVIDRNVAAQARLVGDILDVSQIVTGTFHVNLSPVRFGDAIEAAAESVQPAAQAREIRLETAMDHAAPPVLGDSARLQQVAWNLLSNAIRFAPVGGCVQVVMQPAGGWVELSVVDDGPGIDAALLPHVFDRFRQGDSSSTRRHPGLGLGLAIVRHLVELHGGTVEARNREDRTGALFVVRLPPWRGAPLEQEVGPGTPRASSLGQGRQA